jgi:flagellar biosynthesis/type III secretory pathway M-ring protein FliF/YscJ
VIADIRRTVLFTIAGMFLVLFALRRADIGGVSRLEMFAPFIALLIFVFGALALAVIAVVVKGLIDALARRKAEKQALDAELARQAEEKRIREHEVRTPDEQDQVERPQPPSTTADFVAGLSREFDKAQSKERGE